MENSIISELFNARCDDFESSIMKKEAKCDEDLSKITNVFDKILQIATEDIHEIISKKLEEIYTNILSYNTFWNEKYYNFGIKDGIKLEQELRTNFRERRNNEENFLMDYDADFNDFIENFKAKVLNKNKEYDKVRKDISCILNDYPKVREFYEDNKVARFKKDEINAILKLINLKEAQNMIELRGVFYLGISQKEII